jgi:hypothetical protein
MKAFSHIRHQVRTQAQNQDWIQVCDQPLSQVRRQVLIYVQDHLFDQIKDQVRDTTGSDPESYVELDLSLSRWRGLTLGLLSATSVFGPLMKELTNEC